MSDIAECFHCGEWRGPDPEIERLRAINAELLAVVQRLINFPGLAVYNAALREAHRLIAKAKGE